MYKLCDSRQCPRWAYVPHLACVTYSLLQPGQHHNLERENINRNATSTMSNLENDAKITQKSGQFIHNQSEKVYIPAVCCMLQVAGSGSREWLLPVR